ncbi:MAG: hypothetical protein IT328_27875 [Caldilineaceae bacterium]|nr:hypothetical protein [Caldilineaceae bacterium]
MKKQITTLVEERTIEQARELAGSKRKIGALLTEIVDLVYRHRDLLETNELQDLVITTQPSHPDLEAIVRDQDETIAELAKRMERMDLELRYFRAVVDSATREHKDEKRDPT